MKTYYREPKVDRERIMRGLFAEETRMSQHLARLIPAFFAGVLLVTFVWFFVHLNIEFMSTVLKVYAAIGGGKFLISSLLVGVGVFIVQNYALLLLVSCGAAFMQLRLLSMQGSH